MLKAINQYWREGHFVDLWSINHILSGVVLASLLFKLDISLVVGLGIALVLFVGWELAEISLGIKEHLPNILMDIVCDLAGFLAIAYVVFALDKSVSWLATLGWIALFMFFNIWGFLAYEVRRIDNIKGPRV